MTRYGVGPKVFALAALYGMLMGWFSYRYPSLLSIQCLPHWVLACAAVGLVVVGATIYARALRTFNTSCRNDKLVTEGAYSVVRHPIYAAWIWLIIPGLVLFFRSWALLTVPMVTYAVFKVCIHEEDNHLEQRFGKPYLEYRSKTREIFPFPILQGIYSKQFSTGGISKIQAGPARQTNIKTL